MKTNYKYFFLAALAFAAVACDDDSKEDPTPPDPDPVETVENAIICNEGLWQSDNGQLSYYNGAEHTLMNGWYKAVNGTKLGDTPNDIIQVNDTLVAVAVNWSNLVQFIRKDGTACGATEAVANNRRMCVDGDGNLYITSYAHVCGSATYTKGFVAKIDPKTKAVTASVEVGYEPDGVCYYGGKLYVANTGGYSFSESHDYENTISVVNASTMTVEKTVEIEYDFDGDAVEDKVVNLYGKVAQSGKYLCINSSGDYYSLPASTVVFDCEDCSYKVLNFPATYCTAYDGRFFCVGSAYSYDTGANVVSVHTIDAATGAALEGIVLGDDFSEDGVATEVTEALLGMTNPYDIYISPYTGRIYATDACSYSTAGKLYVFDEDGKSVGEGLETYVNPAHILALK